MWPTLDSDGAKDEGRHGAGGELAADHAVTRPRYLGAVSEALHGRLVKDLARFPARIPLIGSTPMSSV